jgi:hypothetical protein
MLWRRRVTAVIVVLAAVCTEADQSPSDLVYYLGDPQVGFGTSGWQADVARFSYVAGLVANNSETAGVVIAGDLVNVWDNRTLMGGFDEIWPAHFDPAQRDDVHLVPGNHDVDSNAKTADGFLDQLAHYRSAFGPDYHTFSTRFADFFLIDSEALIVATLGLNGTVTDPRILNETETQWRWLGDALNRSTGAHRVLVSHHPPFLGTEDEPHQYSPSRVCSHAHSRLVPVSNPHTPVTCD